MKKIVSLLSVVILFNRCSKAPSACFTYYPSIINAGDVVTFNADCSKNASYFEWSFGDGAADTNTVSKSVTHKYITSGTYIAKLNVKRKDGIIFKKGKPETIISIAVQ